jgi:ABC-2 type transport system permease protein
MYKISFWGPFFVDGSLFLVQVLAFQAIYSQVDSIGDWSQGNMIIFIGSFSLINAINMTIYFFGVNSIPEKIKSGELDLYLTKPTNVLLRLTFEQVNPGAIPLIFLSIGIVLYGCSLQELPITIGNIAAYVIAILFMSVLYYELEVIIRTTAFFFISADGATQLEDCGLELCMQLPGTIFYGVYKIVFYMLLPYGIIATYPTLILADRLSIGMLIHGVSVVIVFFALMTALWRTGLRHYNGVNSQ